MTLTNPSINARFGEPILLTVSTFSPPTEFRCHVVVYENERTKEKRGLVCNGLGGELAEITELFGPGGCQSCCFCCSYGKLTGTDIETAEYEMRFLGTGRIGSRWNNTPICESCYLSMKQKEEKRHASAMQELANRYGGAQ